MIESIPDTIDLSQDYLVKYWVGHLGVSRGRLEQAIAMAILTAKEKEFLDVYLHEATTSPFFRGPASKALSALGVEYRDISYLAWAYHQEVPRTGFEWGHSADVSPPLPWPNREAVGARNQEVQRIWEQQREPMPRVVS